MWLKCSSKSYHPRPVFSGPHSPCQLASKCCFIFPCSRSSSCSSRLFLSNQYLVFPFLSNNDSLSHCCRSLGLLQTPMTQRAFSKWASDSIHHYQAELFEKHAKRRGKVFKQCYRVVLTHTLTDTQAVLKKSFLLRAKKTTQKWASQSDELTQFVLMQETAKPGPFFGLQFLLFQANCETAVCSQAQERNFICT